MMGSSHDPFDDVLNLEEQYYKEGYEEGLKDGGDAGRMEGYSLGLTKGYEKFLEAGRLQSKAVVWANRMPKYYQRRPPKHHHQQQRHQQEDNAPVVESKEGGGRGEGNAAARLPPIQSNPRLEKNLEMLYGLVEPGTLTMDNDDEAVNDFDSRIKGAHARLRLVERAVGEKTGLFAPAAAGKNENIEDGGGLRHRGEAKSTEEESSGQI